MNKEKVNNILLGLLGSEEFINQWWNSPNANWQFKTPEEVWSTKAGQIEIVNYLLKHANYNT